MITPGRPVKDVDIANNSDTDHIFKELAQAGGFEARNVAEGVDILYRSYCFNRIQRNHTRHDQEKMV